MKQHYSYIKQLKNLSNLSLYEEYIDVKIKIGFLKTHMFVVEKELIKRIKK
jgi:hypothetical protein